jgi:hypothetical protein
LLKRSAELAVGKQMRNGKITLDLWDSGNEVSAKWTIGGFPHGKVKIRRGDLKRNCSNIREQLNRLNNYVMENPNLCDNPNLVRESDPNFEQYNDIVRAIHGSGFSIFELLIGDDESLAQLLRGSSRGAEFQVNYDDEDVMIPIGFVCENRNRRIAPEPSLDDFVDCWMYKFTIMNYFNTLSVTSDSLNFRSDNFKTLFAIDHSQWSRCNVDLIERYSEYLPLYQLQLGAKHSWEDIRDAWRDMESGDGLVFFFCEADGLSMQVNNDKIDAHQVKRMFGTRRADCGKNILFLNACLSAKGDDGHSTSLISLLELKHFPCFIGTEAQVANNKALICATHLMHSLCFHRVTLGNALDSMRRDRSLFPTNLFYSLYGPREFALDQALPKPPLVNDVTTEVGWRGPNDEGYRQ